MTRTIHRRSTEPHCGAATVPLWQALVLANVFFFVGLAAGFLLSFHSPLRTLLFESNTETLGVTQTNPGFLTSSKLKPCLWKSHAMPRTEQTGDGGVIKVTSSYGTVEGTTFIVGMTGDASNVKELFLCGAKEPLRSVVLSNSNLKGRDTNFKHFLRIDCPLPSQSTNVH